MFLLRGVVQHYDWGDPHFIPSFLGVPDDGQPWAELWFGTHPNGPADALIDTTWKPLKDVVGDLNVLVKILSAKLPLSLQTHPSRARAQHGYELENSRGIPLTDPTRIYKDTGDKPEMLIALTDFEALCGFAPITESLALLRTLGWTNESTRLEIDGIAGYLRWAYAQPSPPSMDNAPRWLQHIATQYPGDRSLRVAPLLNFVSLSPGEAIALPAGNLHAYLRGSAVEVMSSSDNVIRAGFTAKHVDVDELLDALDTSELPHPKVRTSDSSLGKHYDSPIDAFSVDVVSVVNSAVVTADPRHRILVCTSGNVGELRRGEAALLPGGESVALTGSGTVYVCAGR